MTSSYIILLFFQDEWCFMKLDAGVVERHNYFVHQFVDVAT